MIIILAGAALAAWPMLLVFLIHQAPRVVLPQLIFRLSMLCDLMTASVES